MKTYIKILFLILLSLTNGEARCQVKEPTLVDSGFIYKDFLRGGSTASLYYYSATLDTLKGVTRIAINPQDIDSLRLLFENIKAKKHRQKKVGPGYYAVVYHESKPYKLAILNWGIIDLKRKKEFVVEDTQYFKFYQSFIERNYR